MILESLIEKNFQENLKLKIEQSTSNYIKCKNLEFEVNILSEEEPDFCALEKPKYSIANNSENLFHKKYDQIQEIFKEIFYNENFCIEILYHISMNIKLEKQELDIIAEDFLRFFEHRIDQNNYGKENIIYIIIKLIEKISKNLNQSSYEVLQANHFVNSLINIFMETRENIYFIKGYLISS